jgi:hypothetical protein
MTKLTIEDIILNDYCTIDESVAKGADTISAICDQLQSQGMIPENHKPGSLNRVMYASVDGVDIQFFLGGFTHGRPKVMVIAKIFTGDVDIELNKFVNWQYVPNVAHIVATLKKIAEDLNRQPTESQVLKAVKTEFQQGFHLEVYRYLEFRHGELFVKFTLKSANIANPDIGVVTHTPPVLNAPISIIVDYLEIQTHHRVIKSQTAEIAKKNPVVNTPYIIVLCGSSRFETEFRQLELALSLDGRIVLSLPVFSQANNITLSDADVEALKKVHYAKIDMCDCVTVVNPGGYIGNQTRLEIAYAESLGKVIKYMY